MRLSELEEGRSIPGDCGGNPENRPEWLNFDKFQRALEVYKDNVYSIMLAHVCGVVILSQVPTLVIPVKFTGKSDTVRLSITRLANTLHHVLAWYEGNIWDKENYAFESLQHVRRLHRRVTQKMNEAGVSPPKGHVWLSQYDMALTQFAFLGPVLLGADKTGMQCSDSEMECLIHFWRSVGYLLGIEDRFNICSGDLTETKEFFQEIVSQVVLPTLSNPQAEFTRQLRNGIEAVKTHSPFTDFNSKANLSYDIVNFQDKIPRTWYSLFCDLVRSVVVFLLSFGWFRTRLNAICSSTLHDRSQQFRCPFKTQLKKTNVVQNCPTIVAYLLKFLLSSKQQFEA